MKLKLREKELPPVQLRLVVPAGLKEMLDKYVAFVHEGSGREVEAREIAVEILAQFMESDRQFKQWQRRDRRSRRCSEGCADLRERSRSTGRRQPEWRGRRGAGNGVESEMGRVGHRAR